MPKSSPTTVAAYLATLPSERRAAVAQVRRVIKEHLPHGYQETATKGLITYVVPLSAYSTTYNGHPLWYVALGAQKNCLSLSFIASAESERRGKREPST